MKSLALPFCLGISVREWKPPYNVEDLEGREKGCAGDFVVENGLLKSQGYIGLQNHSDDDKTPFSEIRYQERPH
jgi:hypothetical protein